MANIITRQAKGSPLTFDELDNNFTNINNEVENVTDKSPVHISDFGAVGDGVADDTDAVNDFLQYLLENNRQGIMPAGNYLVTEPITLIGADQKKSISVLGEVADQNLLGGTRITWGGSSAAGQFLIKIDGVQKAEFCNVRFDGDLTCPRVFWATWTDGTESPFGWRFKNCFFENVYSDGACFYIDSNSACARFKFESCNFTPNAHGPGISTGKGFHCVNQNAVSHGFENCSFSQGAYGIYIHGGSVRCTSCEFTLNSVSDLYFGIMNPSLLEHCWSEQSRQFITSDYRDEYNMLTLVSCQCASYPWAYWKYDENNRTQPTNDDKQWACISWDRPSLVLIGCTFNDPNLFANVGSISPVQSSQPTVICPNTHNPVSDFAVLGSWSMNGAGPTYDSTFLSIAGA